MKHLFVRAALCAALVMPFAVQAHKMWLVPSATVVSGDDAWVTVDAAVSNDLYYPDHFPAQLDNLVITAPDGSPVKPENPWTGKVRSAFDLPVKEAGTYRIALVNQGLFANYEVDGQKKRWRGKADELKTGIPANAKNVQVSEMASRVETFVTQGKPGGDALKPTGKGLELVPVTQPGDLVTGEKATFQLLLDGKPAAGLKVTAINGATRYRNAQEEQDTQTDKDGRFTFAFANPGMYWVNANTEDKKTTVKEATQRRVAYTATLEVLPQ